MKILNKILAFLGFLFLCGFVIQLLEVGGSDPSSSAFSYSSNPGSPPSQYGEPAVLPASDSRTCSLSSISVDHLRFWYDDGYSNVTGIITQNCSMAIGVELRFTGYFSDGSVAFTEGFWPNATSNIPSGTSMPFEGLNDAAIKPSRYTITVADTHQW